MIHLTRRQSLFLASALIAFFFLALWLLSRAPAKRSTYPTLPVASIAPTATPEPLATSSSAQFLLNEFHRSEIRGGRKIWEIKAKNGQYFPEKQAAEIHSADVWLFRENGEEIFLQAPEARLGFDGSTLKDAFFPSTVHVVYNNQLTVDTSTATYDKSTEIIQSNHPVSIESELLHIDGNAFVAHVDQKSIFISGGVKTVIKPRQKKP